jgi:hypothetical protein
MNDIEVVQWFFYLSKITEGFNWPVHAEQLASGKRAIDSAVAARAPAEDVLAAYKQFAGAVGPGVMTLLLTSDDAFPEVNHSGKDTPPSPGKVTLYVDPAGKRVLAACSTEWGAAPTWSIE